MNSIVVTGVSRGLGAAIHKLLAQGVITGQCVFISRDPVKRLQEHARYIQVDMANAHILPKLFDIDSNSKTVIFINNAGTIDPIRKAIKVDSKSLQLALNVNCLSPYKLAQQLTSQAKRVGARLFILNVSSGAAHPPIKGWMAYCVSKAAAVMALDVLAIENDHVFVHHFDPGVMDTDMQAFIRNQSPSIMPDVERFRQFQTDHQLKSTDEVAQKIIDILRCEVL